MRKGPTSLVQVGIDIPQVHAGADSCVPCRLIHAVLLKIDEVHFDRTFSHGEVAVRVASRPRLYRDGVVHSTLHDSSDILGRIRAYYSGGRDFDGEVVRFNPRCLVERVPITREGNIGTDTAKTILQRRSPSK